MTPSRYSFKEIGTFYFFKIQKIPQVPSSGLVTILMDLPTSAYKPCYIPYLNFVDNLVPILNILPILSKLRFMNCKKLFPFFLSDKSVQILCVNVGRWICETPICLLAYIVYLYKNSLKNGHYKVWSYVIYTCVNVLPFSTMYIMLET